MPLAHVYVAPGFEEVELITIVDILRRADINTHLVSTAAAGVVAGAHNVGIAADLSFDEAASEIPDLVVLPGGGPGTQHMLAHPLLAGRLHSQFAAGRRVAAICAAPMVLAKAGLLRDLAACCFPGCEATLSEHGAKVSAFNVVTDGLITTSRGPATAGLFALELVRQLRDDATASAVGRAMLYL
ncbi:DJ-1 family glyoxalase III [Chitinibacter sp. ZOR0017]|uniref:DJ-1 family glyoxalase III n=1 Tax=Chitinibacter sp. ZOR0017 TaxID=1339254 RepID=UPI0006480A63|nr:DJ-1 family glyoxalase III [Chitinibacter sp. ZOR0017]